MDKTKDAVFKQIAQTYVDDLGAKIKQENENMHITMDTQELDRKIYSGINEINEKKKKKKILKFTKIFVPMAASFLLLVTIFQIFSSRDFLPAPEDVASSDSMETAQAELLPLSHPLPSNLRVVDSKLDNGMTVYHLENIYDDDVVMQLIKKEDGEMNLEEMAEIEVNGQIVYGRTSDTYNIITFESEGILYTLTCQYDLNTLLPICENIL